MSELADDVAWTEMLARSLANRVVWTGSGGALPWTVFKAGPVSLAYPRFPFGLLHGDAWVFDSWAGVEAELKAAGVDLIRMSAPGDIMTDGIAIGKTVEFPETAIAELARWRQSDLAPRVTRKFRQAEKSGLAVQMASLSHGAKCHSLYVRSVSRQRGSLRYPRRYFDDLCAMSEAGGPARVILATTSDGRTAGFLATLARGETTYYLHGGYQDDCAAMRPGYFLMRWSIESAREAGQRQYNFLTSPPAQPTLVAYKESFGGTTSRRSHWQQPLTRLGRLAVWGLRVVDATRRTQVLTEGARSGSRSG